MKHTKRIIGKRFGKLLVMFYTKRKTNSGARLYWCLCFCGNTKYVTGGNLNTHNVKSCGCLLKENKSYSFTSHV